MISQREARRLRNRCIRLENALYQQRSEWAQEYVRGVQITSMAYPNANDPVPVAVRTAHKLGHAVVVVGNDSGQLRFIALPHPTYKHD